MLKKNLIRIAILSLVSMPTVFATSASNPPSNPQKNQPAISTVDSIDKETTATTPTTPIAAKTKNQKPNQKPKTKKRTKTKTKHIVSDAGLNTNGTDEETTATATTAVATEITNQSEHIVSNVSLNTNGNDKETTPPPPTTATPPPPTTTTTTIAAQNQSEHIVSNVSLNTNGNDKETTAPPPTPTTTTTTIAAQNQKSEHIVSDASLNNNGNDQETPPPPPTTTTHFPLAKLKKMLEAKKDKVDSYKDLQQMYANVGNDIKSGSAKDCDDFQQMYANVGENIKSDSVKKDAFYRYNCILEDCDLYSRFSSFISNAEDENQKNEVLSWSILLLDELEKDRKILGKLLKRKDSSDDFTSFLKAEKKNLCMLINSENYLNTTRSNLGCSDLNASDSRQEQKYLCRSSDVFNQSDQLVRGSNLDDVSLADNNDERNKYRYISTSTIIDNSLINSTGYNNSLQQVRENRTRSLRWTNDKVSSQSPILLFIQNPIIQFIGVVALLSITVKWFYDKQYKNTSSNKKRKRKSNRKK